MEHDSLGCQVGDNALFIVIVIVIVMEKLDEKKKKEKKTVRKCVVSESKFNKQTLRWETGDELRDDELW